MLTKYVNINSLKVAENLLSFVDNELLKGTNISPDKFWSGFDKAVNDLAPKNKELLQVREKFQKKITPLGVTFATFQRSNNRPIGRFNPMSKGRHTHCHGTHEHGYADPCL